ncbi:RNA 3'-terminal phosphate cyclase-domain-containing protein, partial [Podospora conica]
MKEAKYIEIDGRTGEGGGQIVRIACALAAVTTQPIRITNIRANREGPRGGGLKSQHVSSITWLVTATDAEVSGLAIGSKTLEFRPRRKPSDLETRRISIAADSAAASALLILQAILPFLVFAGSERHPDVPIELTVSGGTNVSWSLSFEYLDQVLLPQLESFFSGFRVGRRVLQGRGWSQGKVSRGTVSLTLHPLRPGEALRARRATDTDEGGYGVEDLEVIAVDVSIIAPLAMHEALMEALVQDLGDLFPGVDVEFKITEDSGADSRAYVLLVARSETLRWGRDILTSASGKGVAAKSGKAAVFSAAEGIARKVSKELYAEVSSGGVVDEFLQDQLVIFQALAEGRSSFPRGGGSVGDGGNPIRQGCQDEAGLEEAMENLRVDGERMRRDKTHEPFGEGSKHTTTARWVAAKLLPGVEWYDKGQVCQGAGVFMEK